MNSSRPTSAIEILDDLKLLLITLLEPKGGGEAVAEESNILSHGVSKGGVNDPRGGGGGGGGGEKGTRASQRRITPSVARVICKAALEALLLKTSTAAATAAAGKEKKKKKTATPSSSSSSSSSCLSILEVQQNAWRDLVQYCLRKNPAYCSEVSHSSSSSSINNKNQLLPPNYEFQRYSNPYRVWHQKRHRSPLY
eukprot:jgi/Bigna1/127036/aug1.3_g1744